MPTPTEGVCGKAFLSMIMFFLFEFNQVLSNLMQVIRGVKSKADDVVFRYNR